LGEEGHRVLNVADVWTAPDATEARRSQIVRDLLQRAHDEGAVHVQINCGENLAAANLAAQGAPVNHTFQYRLSK
jgi:hypothetical protein